MVSPYTTLVWLFYTSCQYQYSLVLVSSIEESLHILGNTTVRDGDIEAEGESDFWERNFAGHSAVSFESLWLCFVIGEKKLFEKKGLCVSQR